MYLSPVGYIPFCQDSLIYACWPDIAANRTPFTLNPVSIWMINYMVLIASGDEEVNRLNLLRYPDSKFILVLFLEFQIIFQDIHLVEFHISEN